MPRSSAITSAPVEVKIRTSVSPSASCSAWSVGAKYGGHYFDDRNNQIMTIEEKGKKCPVIGGFTPFIPGGGLYKYTELAPEVEVMISGGPKGKMMPQVWCRHHPKTKAHIFYARYDPNDLKKDEGCRQMIARALFWSAGREVEKK